MKLLFKNARIIDVKSPYNGQELDILVNDEQIEAIGNLKTEQADGVIDLKGCWLTTGFAELHSDLGEPGNEESEDLVSGSAAAASGGFTAVGVVSNGHPHYESKTGIEFILNKSESLPGWNEYFFFLDQCTFEIFVINKSGDKVFRTRSESIKTAPVVVKNDKFGNILISTYTGQIFILDLASLKLSS